MPTLIMPFAYQIPPYTPLQAPLRLANAYQPILTLAFGMQFALSQR